ncbi:MAG: hypothetical protein FWE37_00370 [Spirochaetaceae bacterium]|nr:hypothetical protein [Spirochaetaceae bacterium]
MLLFRSAHPIEPVGVVHLNFNKNISIAPGITFNKRSFNVNGSFSLGNRFIYALIGFNYAHLIETFQYNNENLEYFTDLAGIELGGGVSLPFHIKATYFALYTTYSLGIGSNISDKINLHTLPIIYGNWRVGFKYVHPVNNVSIGLEFGGIRLFYSRLNSPLQYEISDYKSRGVFLMALRITYLF